MSLPPWLSDEESFCGVPVMVLSVPSPISQSPGPATPFTVTVTVTVLPPVTV